jgi:hypothetical protein
MPRKPKSTTPPAGPPPEPVTEIASQPIPGATTIEASRAAASVTRQPRNHRELAQAIFDGRDPVTVGKELLATDGERPNSVKAKVWETLVDFMFGKQPPAASAQPAPNVRIIWDLPAPPHESHKP